MLITIDNVDRMFKAAIILQLDDAVANCVDFIVNHITDYTLERAYALESETRNDLLSEKILEYEIRNFIKLIRRNEFLKFDAVKLQKMLESDDLNVRCEKDVFEAVKLWYEHDSRGRKQHLADIIGCLRLTQFDTNFLLTHIQPLPGCELIAYKAVAWINTPFARSKLTLKYTKPRGGKSEVAEEFLALNMKGITGAIYQYNKSEGSWQKWYNIKTDTFHCKVILMKENLFFIGGWRQIEVTEEVSSLNLVTKTFKRLPSMKHPRFNHSVVLLNDKIYAIGGRGREKIDLGSAECMHSVSNKWQPINGMIKGRSAAAAVTLNGKIYVMGGFNEGRLKSVERYDPITDCWTQCADMNEEHSLPGATVHKGQIYVVGGSGLGTVERYDPQINEWTKICCLSVGRASMGCISIYNELWAIGGENTNCVYVYDDQNDKWIDENPIPSEGKYYCFTLPKALLQSNQKCEN